MKKYVVERKEDVVVVTILKNKSDNTFSFVNLTKKHICPCRFKSIEEAVEDMNRQMKEGKITRFIELNV